VSNELNDIAITGAGLVTPQGLSRRQTWENILAMRPGMGPMSAMESPLPSGADGGQAPDLPPRFEPALPRETRYLRHAILEALDEAKLGTKRPYAPARCGIILGTTLHGMRRGGEFFRTADHGKLATFLAGPVLRDAAKGLHLEGCGFTTCSACSSSLGAVALAVTLLRAGQLDLILTGGYDAISEYVYGGFNSLRLVAPGPLRPFARDRRGMKLAEGYGIVALERESDARARGANVLAKVLGYGESADAHHLTQPHPTGDGATRAIRAAITDAELTPADIDMAAAHATGTPDNDAAEYTALSSVFASDLPRVPVVAFKSHLGHTLGGAGVVELILSATALAEQTVPASVNVKPEDIDFAGLSLATGAPKPAPIRATLNTSLGFGGANTAVVLGKPGGAARHTRPRQLTKRDIFISGIGVVFPGLVGNDAFARHLENATVPVERDTGSVSDEEIGLLLNARRVRRMSDYVKLSLAAATLCLRHAGVEDVPAFAQTCCAVLGTTHGSTNYCEAYYGQIVKEGIAAANPMLFAEGVPNAAAAHLSLMLSLKGACQTIIGSRTSGLDAVRIAAARIASGEWDRALVGAAEEYSPVVNEAYRHQGLYGGAGFVAGAGAVTFLLESRDSMQPRGAKAFARVTHAAGAQSQPRLAPRLARRVFKAISTPQHVICSANDTWIGRAEAAGTTKKSLNASSIYGYIAECSSALPLAGIAAVLLTGRLPRPIKQFEGFGGSANPQASVEVTDFAALSTDYGGAVSAVSVERLLT
jgi:3-oxoacyl-[acyl-carrier-protein] synthase II